jgi:uncharacterized protein YjbJ (UPF0337 family)
MEGRATGLLDKAKEAADHAAERARSAAESAADRASVASDQARVVAGQLGRATGEAVGTATTAVTDPANQAKAKVTARAGLSKAKSGLSGMIDRIDPGLMADLVIKSTTLQEKANRSLREKGSPYRINEITITAGIPPDVAFTIGRIDVLEEDPAALGEDPDAIEPSTITDSPLDDEAGLAAAAAVDGGPDGRPDGRSDGDLDPLLADGPAAEPGGGVLEALLGGGPEADDPIPELVAEP